jgi:hypothetical protein
VSLPLSVSLAPTPPSSPNQASHAHSSRVARQDAVYYRITVDQVKSKNGFIVFCRSLTGKFKLVLFDSNGEVIHIDESLRSRDGSQWESSLYFLSAFSMYRLPPPVHAAIQEQDVPSVFNSLDSFTQCNLSLPAGQYLICVYGDNFIGKTSYSLLAVPTLNDCQEVRTETERGREREILSFRWLTPVLRLRTFKSSTRLFFKPKTVSTNSNQNICRSALDSPPASDLPPSLPQAKENYEMALKKVQRETERVEELIEKREFSYGSKPLSCLPPPSLSADSSSSLSLSEPS